MFGPITVPFGAKMLFNTVKLKPGVTFEDVEIPDDNVVGRVGDGWKLAMAAFDYTRPAVAAAAAQPSRSTAPIRALLKTTSPELVPSRCANACGRAAAVTFASMGSTNAGRRALTAGP